MHAYIHNDMAELFYYHIQDLRYVARRQRKFDAWEVALFSYFICYLYEDVNIYGKNLFLTSMHIPMAVLNKGNSNATFQIDKKMRRILMTTWVGEAWENGSRICVHYLQMFREDWVPFNGRWIGRSRGSSLPRHDPV